MNTNAIGTLRDLVDEARDQDLRQLSRFRRVKRIGQDVAAKAECPVLKYLGEELERLGNEGEKDETLDVETHNTWHALVEQTAEHAKKKSA